MVRLFVLDVAEFEPLLAAAKTTPGCTISGPRAGYWDICAEREISFNRKRAGLRPALWYSAVVGGYVGKIEQYDRDDIRITAED
mgnify:CR=1 FL=1